ncbi:hypothetical protein BC828DRAFT_372822 [Blastocladiella britannica]|nr:hypothetical protein BC828DRAFT_372822 [Blastocladiella britannica]
MEEIPTKATSRKRSRPPMAHKTHKRTRRAAVRAPPSPVDIYVKAGGTSTRAYLSRARTLLDLQQQPHIYIHGLGKAIQKAAEIATTLAAQSLGNLVMEVTTGTQQVVDDMDYEDEDLEPEADTRSTSVLTIKISKKKTLGGVLGQLKEAASRNPADDI